MSYDPGPLLPLVRFGFVFILFIVPGYWWATWLHRPHGYCWPFRLVLGFAWSLAVVAIVGWPFLWWQGSYAAFRLVLGAVWTVFAIVGFWCYCTCKQEPSQAQTESTWTETAERTSLGRSWPALGLWFAYLGIGAAGVWAGLSAERLKWGWDEPEWTAYGCGVFCWFLLGCVLAWWSRRSLANLIAFEKGDDAEPSRWITAIAVAFIVLQAFSAAALDRPDWDDCYYLAAVLDFQHADVFNDQEPSHREGFPVSAHNLLIVWELWGSVVCDLSDLNPMAVFHTLLPGLLVLLAYAAYWQVVKEFVPRRWVPFAMLGIAAYHLWGVSSHNTPANYLLTRISQGKGTLLHVGLPLLVVLQTRFMRQPELRGGLGLVAGSLFGLAASSSAVFLEPMLLSCLALAFLGLSTWRTWFIGTVGSALAAVPAVVYGLLIRRAVLADSAVMPHGEVQWNWERWFEEIGSFAGEGSAEAMWLLTLPLLAALLGSYRRGVYLIGFPLWLTVTFNNPLLCSFVSNHLTSAWTYFRIFWLLPVAAGLGVFAALFARMLARAIVGSNHSALEFVIVALLILGLALTWFLPGLYVWGEENVSMLVNRRAPPWSPNILKMPNDLVVIADYLRQDNALSRSRILCNDSVANYLTPYARDFRFLQTRSLYTLPLADAAGRREEGVQRFLLGLLLSGHIPQDPGARPLQVNHPYYNYGPLPAPPERWDEARVRQELEKFKVRHAIIPTRPGALVQSKFRQVGFIPLISREYYTLWTRR